MEIKKFKRNNRETGLWSIFLRYLLTLAAGIIVLGIVYISLLMSGLSSGIILPANHAEKQITENKQAIMESEPFDESLIPFYCQYGLFDESGNYIRGTFSEETIADAKLCLQNDRSYRHFYIRIDRKDEICLVQYDLHTHFSSPVLNRLVPDIGFAGTTSFIILLLLLVIYIAVLFAKKLKAELRPLMEATEKIKDQDLEFEVKTSKIREFNEVTQSLGEMKDALSSALKNEWEAEERKKRHISALAHDIKTPLTVIKGNAELLLEEPLSEECRDYASSIEQKADTIEAYIRLLIETVKGENSEKVTLKWAESKNWIAGVTTQAQELCNMQKVTINCRITDMPDRILLDEESLARSVLNIIRNSLEHSGSSRIELSFTGETNFWHIDVEDFGKGFSKEALQQGDQPFYTQDQERSGKHYGLGLYIAKMAAEGHGGKLEYSNKQDSKGAVVKMTIPIKEAE